MFERIAIVVQSLALALWLGALAGFAFIFAPIAFRTIGNMATFAAVTGGVIRSLATFGSICGGIVVVASFFRLGVGKDARIGVWRNVLVVFAMLAINYEKQYILPKMDAVASQIPGPIDSVAKDDPRRIAYDEQHDISTRVYGFGFLCVAAATALVAFGRTRKA